MERVLVGKLEPYSQIGSLTYDKRQEERKGLVKLLKENDIPYLEVDCEWPRDSYTRINGQIYTSREHGNYADGGYVLTPKGITIAGAEVSLTDEGRIHDSQERLKILKKLYGPSVRVMPSPPEGWNENLSPHLDLVLFPLAEQKVLFADSHYYSEFRTEVEKLAEETGWKIKLVRQDWDNPTYPCNSLLLENGSIGRGRGQVALVGSEKNEDFIRSLRDLGIEVLSTPFRRNSGLGGGINCATNTIEETRLKEVEKYLR